MALGGLLGGLGVELPGVEIGIAVSAVVLGAMVTLAMRPPLWVAVRMRAGEKYRPMPSRLPAASRPRAKKSWWTPCQSRRLWLLFRA